MTENKEETIDVWNFETCRMKTIKLPAQIEQAEQWLYDEQGKLVNIKNNLDVIEGKIAFVVATEVDEESKKVYTNETSRKSEVQKRLGEHDEFSQHKNEEVKTYAEIDRLKRMIKRLEREYKTACLLIEWECSKHRT